MIPKTYKKSSDPISIRAYEGYTKRADSVNLEERTVVHYASTIEVNSYNEILLPDGGDFESRFQAVLYQHVQGWSFLEDATRPPSAIIIGGMQWHRADDYGNLCKTEFAQTELGDDILYYKSKGWLKSWSVGFRPKDEDAMYVNENGVLVIPNWYCYEYSSVIFPANVGAKDLSDLKDYTTRSAKSDVFKSAMLSGIDVRLATHALETEGVQELEELKSNIESMQSEIDTHKADAVRNEALLNDYRKANENLVNRLVLLTGETIGNNDKKVLSTKNDKMLDFVAGVVSRYTGRKVTKDKLKPFLKTSK